MQKPFGSESGVTLLGAPGPAGTYLLRMRVAADVAVVYGRFAPHPILTPAGEVVYVGSALGRKGAGTLARRLLRHASRAGDQPPHAIRPALAAAFGVQPPPRKTLRWHVDYLLQETAVSLTHVLAIRSPHRLEAPLSRRLNAQPHLRPVAPGLGASDMPGPGAHLLHSPDPLDDWWAALPAKLTTQFPQI